MSVKVGDWIEHLDSPSTRGIVVSCGGRGDDVQVLVSGEQEPRIIWKDDLDRWWEPLHIDPKASMPPFWAKEGATFIPRSKAPSCVAHLVGVRPGWVAYWVKGGTATRQQVATIEELAQIKATEQPDGTEVEVKSIGEVYQLAQASTARPDSVFTVMPNSGSGRWVRTASTHVRGSSLPRLSPAPMFFIIPWSVFHGEWTPEKPPTAWARLLVED